MSPRVLPCLLLAVLPALSAAAAPIDRPALVTRHNPVLDRLDPEAPLSVGNGGFDFSVDITGLQTFPDYYLQHGIPAETLARWAWHTEANPEHYSLADAMRPYTAFGRTVDYPTNDRGPAGAWLRRNPQLLPVGQIGLVWAKDAGTALAPAEVQQPRQTLDLWTGTIHSDYQLDGTPVRVETVCHPDLDLVAVRIDSNLVAEGRIGVEVAFPHGFDLAIKNTPPLDWSHPEAHQTVIVDRRAGRVDLARTVDDTRYAVAIAWAGDAGLRETAPHHFLLTSAPGRRTLKFVVAFAPGSLPAALPDVLQTLGASARHWEKFWRSGAAVDFSGSRDPRAAVLEGRVVLAQYLTAIQLGGDVPPQESGLTCSTWYGKFHTEMMWWHLAHFALWGHDAYVARGLTWYQAHLPLAREIARSRGLRGARWPKMVGPEGRESPGGNPLIVWNQPHPIYLAELLYRNEPTTATLAQYRDVVFETADCLASMLHFDAARGEYVLGPPLWIVQEIYDPATSQNPTFELAYWRFALGVAQQWRERLGLPREPQWDDILQKLAPLPVKDGRYVALESHPDTWENLASRHDHPEMLMALGVLPGTGVDRTTMGRTLDAVLQSWDWQTKIWGWDYPMIAMTAARLGRPNDALDILLRDGPNNHYLPNGQCPQRGEGTATAVAPGAHRYEIAAYLPANGALLSAVALMVAGWDGCTEQFPGFPHDGSWTIRAEGLHRLP
ncbi:MAG TPA: hypothetical protein VMD31_03345 [Opitutaceae bacterium]|nr:hypothetical protein [Opitutaceae bacterium]